MEVQQTVLLAEEQDGKRCEVRKRKVEGMDDFGFREMQQIQRQLQEKYKDKWQHLSPDIGKEQLLCYGISIDEFSKVYREKHQRNMNRW